MMDAKTLEEREVYWAKWPNGDAGDAIDFACDHAREPAMFLEDWRADGAIEWPEYQRWLSIQREGARSALRSRSGEKAMKLAERLRRYPARGPFKHMLVNPDGPEAADEIDRLTTALNQAEAALERARGYIACVVEAEGHLTNERDLALVDTTLASIRNGGSNDPE